MPSSLQYWAYIHVIKPACLSHCYAFMFMVICAHNEYKWPTCLFHLLRALYAEAEEPWALFKYIESVCVVFSGITDCKKCLHSLSDNKDIWVIKLKAFNLTRGKRVAQMLSENATLLHWIYLVLNCRCLLLRLKLWRATCHQAASNEQCTRISFSLFGPD